ncbi:hypothetical protein PSP6_10070 [Paraburkholderia tropica]|nr:hypothetical protein PSP6_10070 [Paraburkholderia tropica]
MRRAAQAQRSGLNWIEPDRARNEHERRGKGREWLLGYNASAPSPFYSSVFCVDFASFRAASCSTNAAPMQDLGGP